MAGNRARWGFAHFTDDIFAATRAMQLRKSVRNELIDILSRGDILARFVVFQRPLLFRPVDKAQMMNARIFLGCIARFHKIWNDERQQKRYQRNADIAGDEPGNRETAATEHPAGLLNFYERNMAKNHRRYRQQRSDAKNNQYQAENSQHQTGGSETGVLH